MSSAFFLLLISPLSFFVFCRRPLRPVVNLLLLSTASRSVDSLFIQRQPSSSADSLLFLLAAFLCRFLCYVGSHLHMLAAFFLFLSATFSFYWQPTSSVALFFVSTLFLLSATFSFCWQPTCSVRILPLLSAAFTYCRHPFSSVSSIFLLSSAFFLSTTFSFCRQPLSVSNLHVLLSAFFFCQQLRVLLAAYYSGVILILLSLPFSLCQKPFLSAAISIGSQPSFTVVYIVLLLSLSAAFCFLHAAFSFYWQPTSYVESILLLLAALCL